MIPLDVTPATIQTTGTGTDTVNMRGTFRAGTTVIPRGSSDGLAINLLGIYLLEGPDKAVLAALIMLGASSYSR